MNVHHYFVTLNAYTLFCLTKVMVAYITESVRGIVKESDPLEGIDKEPELSKS